MSSKFIPSKTEELASSILKAMQKDRFALLDAPKELLDNVDFMREAVKLDWHTFSYASDRLKNDPVFVLEAVREDWRIIRNVSEDLQNNPDIMLEAIKEDPEALSYGKKLRKDPVFIPKAVKEDWHVLPHVPKEMRSRDILLEGVRQDWHALAYAPEEADPDLIQIGVQQDQRAWMYASTSSREAISQPAIQPKQQPSNPSQVLNFLWINLDIPPKPDPKDGSIRMPLPEEYIKSVRNAGRNHPEADVHLWVDSKRLTKKQYDYLEAVVESELPNVRIKDLRSIPEYANEELYTRTETREDWRDCYNGVVWLQVDAAKILVSLQGDYDQHFFSDMDHAHVDIRSDKVQGMLNKHGLMIGRSTENALASALSIENQLWGFDRSRKQFFESYYTKGLRISYRGHIAYEALPSQVSCELHDCEKIPFEEISLPISEVGLKRALQPGHEWSGDSDYKGRSAIPGAELEAILKKRRERTVQAAKNALMPARI